MHITKRHGLAPSRYTLLASAMLAAALPSAWAQGSSGTTHHMSARPAA